MAGGFYSFLKDEEGMGTVEVILIMVVLVGLVVIFKKQLNDLVKKIFNKISSDSSTILSRGAAENVWHRLCS